MRNVRFRVAYDGSRFFGWQRQDGFTSVQQALEEAFFALCGERVVVHGAGRTDTGVHALGQVAHVHLASALDDDRVRHALNALVGPGVTVEALETCRDDFHARFHARSKRYLYLVASGRFRPPFGSAYAHWVRWPLDFERMRSAARRLVGRHDFRAFGNTGSPRPSTVRTLQHLRLVTRRKGFAFVLQADGFLYNMVRNIVGTLIDVGRGRLSPEEVARALEQGQRADLGPTAPAAGLYLASVQYDETLFGVEGHSGSRAPATLAGAPLTPRPNGATLRDGGAHADPGIDPSP
jgi:tRNA pseudouridine38-40 synthase